MRSQVSNNSGQTSGSNDQKKSVFDRLGRQIDAGHPMKRRPSPGQYGDYMPPPPPSVHEADFGRYGPRDPHSRAEMEWRYQNERRHMGGPYPRDGRHPAQMQPGPPAPLPPPHHYEMDLGNGRQPAYYPNPHPYHEAMQGPPPPPPMGLGNISMSMHQQRSSPKYDRHGNLIVGFKDRSGGPMRGLGPMDHDPGMSPSRGFMPPGPMMHQGPHDMQQGMRPPLNMYPPPRWPENMEPEFQPPPPHPLGRMIQDGRFSPASSRRYQLQQQQQQQMINPQANDHPNTGGDVPRYTKWRERRDVITNLDKETAQSSSRTDSLKSTLQQPDNKAVGKGVELPIDQMKQSKGSLSKQQKADAVSRKESYQPTQTDTIADKESQKQSTKAAGTSKTDQQEISDGEIVDDEDSSDDSETVRAPNETGKDLLGKSSLDRSKNHSRTPYVTSSRESRQYYESNNKKRRLLEREEYSMDYETISDDEDLDDFMGDKKVSDLSPEEAKLTARLGDDEGKSLSEIELLNSLGLDWANLVEMAKKSKATGKENSSQGSALPRFSITNYLPTLGITQELAGAEIYDLVSRVCRP